MKLRLLEKKDVLGMLEWMHDPAVNCFFRFHADSMTEEKALSFIENAKKQAEEGKNYHFAITDQNDEYLGTISLKEVDWEAKVAEYAISLRKMVWGRGIATQATKEILKYAFETLELNKIFLNVISNHEKAIHLYEKCGFRFEGEFKNHIFVKGEIKSLQWFRILKEEYLEDQMKNENTAK